MRVRPSPDNAHNFSHSNVVFQIDVAPHRKTFMIGISGFAFAKASRSALQVEIEASTMPVLSRADWIANKEASGREKDLLGEQILRQYEE